jgi:hypothetical protein
MLFRSLLRGIFRGRGLGRRKSWLDELTGLADIYQLSPKFNENYWEANYTEIIESMVDYAGNAGQVTLLTEYFPDPAKLYCSTAEEDYNPEEFVNFVQGDLGDTYFYAINEIVEECSLILQEVWDQAKQTLMEGFLGPSFSDFPTSGRLFGNNRQALFNYQAASIRKGYRPSTNAANRRFNSEINRQSLIKRFGAGPTRSWKSSSGMESVPGYAAYQQAAARNRKIIRP